MSLEAWHEMSAEMTGISGYTQVVFGSGIPRDSSRSWSVISTFCIHCFADQFTLHLLTLFFYFCFITKQKQKLSSFFTFKGMAIQPEKHEDGLDKEGEVYDSLGDVSYSKFQCHSLIQIIFEMTQFKMP